MPPSQPRLFAGSALLASAAVWLVSVTLCSSRVVAAPPHDHGQESAGHAHGDSHEHGPTGDDGCGCESFKAFPAKPAALAKVPAPASPLLLFTFAIEGFNFRSARPAGVAHGTDPPGRLSPADRIWQQCRLNHAPPAVA